MGNPPAPDSITGTVPVGRYLLEVGALPGTSISAPAQQEDGDPRPLARALRKAGDDRKPGRAAAGPLADGLEAASQATAKAERAVALFKTLAEGKPLDPRQLSGEIDALLDLLKRLDRAGRWGEALRLARALSALLALTRRWAELVRSLQVAVRAATKVGDLAAVGWARHELGTLHLAAEDASGAERALGAAREIRHRLGDRDGLGATERNLGVLDRQLRQLVRAGKFGQRRGVLRRDVSRFKAVLAIAGASVLFAGGVTSGGIGGGAGEQASAASGGTERPDDGKSQRRAEARSPRVRGPRSNVAVGAGRATSSHPVRIRHSLPRVAEPPASGGPAPRATIPRRKALVDPGVAVDPPVEVNHERGGNPPDCGQETSGSRERGALSTQVHAVDRALDTGAQLPLGSVVHNVNCDVIAALGL